MHRPSPFLFALHDLKQGFSKSSLSFELAVEDLRDRYRRSYIGVAWIMISFLAFIVIKQVVFSGLALVEGYDFFSHLVIGFTLFTFMSAIIPGAANLYFANRTWILSSNLPYVLYINKLIFHSFIELLLVSTVATLLIVIFGDARPANIWTILPSLLVYYLSAFALCLTLGPIGARWRDSVYAIQAIMRMLFFATPIIWVASPGTVRETIAKWNPLTYYLDIIRVPLITGEIPVEAWLVTTSCTTLLLALGIIVFTATRKRIAHWL
ncbi:ABC transporter permease [Pseudohoeflea coraliihabitans]|uniref:ABC transporter permease n=1 Tax=Pseudohoeflea coraliihabitans TaxID=2860393 RepID=A0ABS6WLQ1_9HYPH|nr:ABC transporter permease [Pseudohoeflea sp. DP4N28-3]MBW3096892.1 ABC transporter permease [Pseudohoeflea sp. DP4N28-3]